MKENQNFSDEGKVRISHQQTYPKRTAKESSRNRNEIIKKGTLAHQQGRMWGITIDFPSLEFSDCV